MHAPLISYPQRGSLKLDFELLYSGAAPLTSCRYRSQSCTENILYPNLAAYSSGNYAPLGVYPANADSAAVYSRLNPLSVGTNIYYGLVFGAYEADGAEHLLGDLGTVTGFGSLSGYTDSSTQLVYSGPFESLDATGWSYSDTSMTAPSTATLTSPDVAVISRRFPQTVVRPRMNETPITIKSNLAHRHTPIRSRHTLSPFTRRNRQCKYLELHGAAAHSRRVHMESTWLRHVKSQLTLVCFRAVEYPAISNISGSGQVVFMTMLQSVILPNGTSWTFQYEDYNPISDPAGTNYGNLTSITLPTGGTIAYTYSNCPSDGTMSVTYKRCVSTEKLTPTTARGHTCGLIIKLRQRTMWLSKYLFSPGPGLDPVGNSTIHNFQLGTDSEGHYETSAQYYDSANNLLENGFYSDSSPPV